MTKTLQNEKENKKKYSDKKPLKEILMSYLQKNQKEKSIKKIKKDFLNLKLNLKKSQTSFETLLDIQKKMNLAYNNIEKNGDKKTKKDN